MSTIPPLIPPEETGLAGKKRKIYAELDADTMFLFDQQAHRRQVTPYKLACAVLSAFAKGQLLPPEEASSAPLEQ